MILSIQPWTRKLRLLEARKRAERPKARRRVFVAGDDMAARERVSNVRQAGRGRVARPCSDRGRRGRPLRPVPDGRRDGPCVILPGGMRESPCDGPERRCIVPEPQAPGRRGRPSERKPVGRQLGAGRILPRSRRDVLARSRHAVVAIRRRPLIHRSPQHSGITIAGWTRSRSGAPRSESSRFRCRPPTTRRGCGTPISSTWTTSGSGSPSRTASPRTGSRPATGP